MFVHHVHQILVCLVCLFGVCIFFAFIEMDVKCHVFRLGFPTEDVIILVVTGILGGGHIQPIIC